MITTDQLAGIRKQIADNSLESAIQAAMELTIKVSPRELHTEALRLSEEFEAYQTSQKAENAEPTALRTSKNQISVSLLDLIDKLEAKVTQEAPDTPSKKVSEQKLKRHIFILLVVIKVLILLFVLTLWQSGSNFTQEEFIATLGILVPVFATYLGLMFKEQLAQRHELTVKASYVSKGFQRTVYLLLLAYGLSFFIILNLKGPGTINHTQMIGLLTMVEAGLGVYIGQLVSALFKEKKN